MLRLSIEKREKLRKLAAELGMNDAPARAPQPPLRSPSRPSRETLEELVVSTLAMTAAFAQQTIAKDIITKSIK